MITPNGFAFHIGSICLLSMFSLPSPRVYAQTEANTSQLQSLIPDAQDLPGFTRVRPAGWGHKSIMGEPSLAVVVEDKVTMDADASQWAPGWQPIQGSAGRYNQITRCLYSTDDVHYLLVTVNACDTPQTAAAELQAQRQASSAHFEPGIFSGSNAIGDESWFDAGGGLFYRVSNLFVELAGNGWVSQTNPEQVTPAAVETVADEILLRASGQAKLTGVSAHDAHVAVNGRPLANNTRLASGQVYVPVTEFAQAMGYTSRWDAKTGGLTLSKAAHQSVTLTAGSTAAKVGTRAVALKTPVLKEKGQPVMTLADLLTLVDGRVVQKGDTYQVKT